MSCMTRSMFGYRLYKETHYICLYVKFEAKLQYGISAVCDWIKYKDAVAYIIYQFYSIVMQWHMAVGTVGIFTYFCYVRIEYRNVGKTPYIPYSRSLLYAIG